MATSTLRLIGGQWRGRRLPIADAAGLRPTADRVRETLFNWLQAELAESEGTAANLDLPVPGVFVWRILRDTRSDRPDSSDYERGRLVWHLYALLPGLDIPAVQRYLAAEPRDPVYIPGGARHKIDAVGDERHEGLVAMPADPVARVEMLEGASPYRMEDWPVALWVDRKRDEVVEKDDDAVST